MNPTAASKPKVKFSSRNLSAVFKAPLGTKPLPDNATGPLQRPTNHMLVLGRATVAPPAPINTPSLKKESQVYDVRVSLVPAGSNWAENAEKRTKNDASNKLPDAADVATPTAVSEEVWTPKSVVKHLHTSSVVDRSNVTIQSSGRWGDDAVENDIVQKNIRLQIQKEREFPDLKQTMEEAQACSGYGHRHGQSFVTDEMQSIASQRPEERHGRATGRWAHFNEEGEPHHSIQTTNSRWCHGQYGRDQDDRWSRSQSRHDVGYEQESRQHGARSDAVSSIGYHTHFSRSDVRFDTMASSDRDHHLNHSIHCMDWGNGPRRDTSVPPASPSDGKNSRAPQSHRSSSPPPTLLSSPKAADLAPRTTVREIGPTLVDDESQSCTESSNCSASSLQQGQLLLERPKMLFDPKTGVMVNANDKVRPHKRQPSGRCEGKERNAASTSKASESTSTSKLTDSKSEMQVKAPTLKSKSAKAGRKKANVTANVVGTDANASQTATTPVSKTKTCASDISCATSLDAAELTAGQGAGKGIPKGRSRKRATAKGQSLRQETKPCATKTSRKSRSSTFQNPQLELQHRSATVKVCEPLTPRSSEVAYRKRVVSTRYDQFDAEGDKAAQRGLKKAEGDTQKLKSDPMEIASATQTMEGSKSGVMMPVDDGIEVSRENDGFETVKSRRAVLDKKNSVRASLEKHASVQSKGEEVQENFGIVTGVSKAAVRKLRGKAANTRRNSEQSDHDRKSKRWSKHSTRSSKSRNQEVPGKAKDCAVDASQVGVRLTEQIAGEAPAESSLSKKSAKTTKAPLNVRKDRQDDEVKGNSIYKVKDQTPSSSSGSIAWTQEQSKWQRTERSAHSGVRTEGSAAPKPRASSSGTARARPNQVRQVYVVKTPTTASVSATLPAA